MALVLGGALAVSASADSYNRHVRINNHTSQAIWEIHGSNVNNSNYGPDRLGNRTVPAGQSIDIDFDDGSNQCMFDLKVILHDHQEIVRRRVNVCEIETWTLED
jgi:hypothetical protein